MLLKKSNKDITLVFYQDQKRTSAYNFNKNNLKFLIYLIPAIVVISITTLVGVTFYFETIKEKIESTHPEIITSLQKKNDVLIADIDLIKNKNQELLIRLSKSNVSTSLVPNLFSTPPGQTDLTTQNTFDVEKILIRKDEKEVKVSFNLKNTTKDQRKVSGYFFVMLVDSNGLQIFPKNTVSLGNSLTSFNRGEPFGTSRFRPISATFNLEKTTIGAQNKAIYFIVFSRLGDLLFKREIGKL